MASTRYTGPAMNLANMRSIGVRTIEAGCECGHTAIVDVERLPGAIEVARLFVDGSNARHSAPAPMTSGRTGSSIGGREWA